MAAAQKGSVITNDYAVNILVRLGSIKQYEENVFPLLNELIFKSPVNQLPTYAEKALPYVNAKNKNAFLNTLNARLHEVEQDTKRKRLEKVIQKVNKMP
jgi:5,10-methylene-tetrahydrofolate dehydrogenase/methenyl tetrahydrofolate cyclohydrolase